MATDDLQILVTGQAAAPAGFLIPGNGQIKPKSLRAVFDGTNASGDFLPTLEVVSDAGILVVQVAAPTVTAGASAAVSWFPWLASAATAPGVISAEVETDVGTGSFTTGAHDLTFTATVPSPSPIVAIDGVDATLLHLLQPGFYFVGAHIGFNSYQNVTTQQILRAIGFTSAAWTSDLAQVDGDSALAVNFSFMAGFTFMNVTTGTHSMHLRLVAGESLSTCNGAGLAVIRLGDPD